MAEVTQVTDWLEAEHPHQTPAWARAGVPVGTELVALRATEGRSGVVLPLYVGPDWARSVDGYGGPMAWGDSDTVALCLAQCTVWLAERGVLAAYVRANPTAPCPPIAIGGDVIEVGPTVVVPVGDPDWMLSRISKSARRNIRQCRDAGFRVTTSPFDLEGFDRLRAVSEAVDHDVEPFACLLGSGVDVELYEVWTAEDQHMASTVATRHGGIVELDTAAVWPEFTDRSPLKISDWRTMVLASERGDRWVHLGGPVECHDCEDGVLYYKLRMGGVIRPDLHARWIMDADRYAARCAEAGVDPDSAWFPPWTQIHDAASSKHRG